MRGKFAKITNHHMTLIREVRVHTARYNNVMSQYSPHPGITHSRKSDILIQIADILFNLCVWNLDKKTTHRIFLCYLLICQDNK